MSGLLSSELPWLLALIFIFLGAGVFYVSSLVSGHNIYRDLRVEVAMLATGIVGILLFVFSPLSYIVLTPSLYIPCFEETVEKIKHEDSIDKLITRATTIYENYTGKSLGAANTPNTSHAKCPPTPRNSSEGQGRSNESQENDCSTTKEDRSERENELRSLICKIHELTIAFPNGILYPYLVSAFALGLIFGCAQVVRPRELFLDYIRHSTDISFSIYSYQFSWDEFLHSIKTNGEITVKRTDQSPVTGRLRAFSVKEEPKEIMLETKNCGILVTKSDAIEHIEVPESSYKRDRMSANPTSHAFYMMLLLVGLLLFFFSSSYTAKFTAEHQFLYLAQAYWIFALVVLLLVYLFCIVKVIPKILGKEFSNWVSALLLQPAFFWSLWLHWGLAILALQFQLSLVPSVFGLSKANTQGIEPIELLSTCIWVGFVAYLILLLYDFLRHSDIEKKLEGMVNRLLRSDNPDYASLRNLRENLEHIYQKQDLNDRDREYWENLLSQLVPPAGSDMAFYAGLADEVKDIIEKSGPKIESVIERDQFAIVNRLRFLVAKRLEKKGGLCVAPQTPARASRPRR